MHNKVNSPTGSMTQLRAVHHPNPYSTTNFKPARVSKVNPYSQTSPPPGMPKSMVNSPFKVPNDEEVFM